MAIETIGRFQLRLFAEEVPGTGKWRPYLRIDQFDDDAQDFRCIVDNHRASEELFESADAAVEEARRLGNQLIKQRKL